MKEADNINHKIDKYLNDAIKYYQLGSSKERQDINTILHQINTTTIDIKQANRLTKYAKRYKVLIEANHINSQSRLNKLYRKPLTSSNLDIE